MPEMVRASNVYF